MARIIEYCVVVLLAIIIQAYAEQTQVNPKSLSRIDPNAPYYSKLISDYPDLLELGTFIDGDEFYQSANLIRLKRILEINTRVKIESDSKVEFLSQNEKLVILNCLLFDWKDEESIPIVYKILFEDNDPIVRYNAAGILLILKKITRAKTFEILNNLSREQRIREFKNLIKLDKKFIIQDSPFFVFSHDNSLPPSIDSRKINPLVFEQIKYQLGGNVAEENTMQMRAKDLKDMFGLDLRLWAYSAYDHDQDGIYDWQYSANEKKFYPQDLDLDQDGVLNLEDENLYDAKILFQDINGNHIPDHLEYKNIEMLKLQEEIRAKTGVIAFDRDYNHSSNNLKIFLEVAVNVFGNVLKTNNDKIFKFPSLKYLSASKGSNALLYGTHRYFYKMLDLHQGFTSLSPLSAKLTMIHEMGHALHQYIDQIESSSDAFNEKTGYVFNNLLKKYFADDGGKYLDKTQEQWAKTIYDESIKIELNILIDASKKAVFSASSKIAQENGIISFYGIGASSEYFAEAVVAYYVKSLLKKLLKDNNIEAYDVLLKGVINEYYMNPLFLPQSYEDFIENYLHLNS